MPKVFVHGALRKGGEQYEYVAGGTSLGAAATREQYALCRMNRKVLVTKRPVSPVRGEVYDLTDDQLALVDRLEGHPRINQRELVPVELAAGGTVEAWLYFHVQPLRDAVVIESGDASAAG